MTNDTPVAYVAAKKQADINEWAHWVKDSKLNLKYAYVKTSPYRFRIIMYDGAGRCGEEQWAMTRFVFITPPMKYEEMQPLLKRLVTGDKTALDSIERMDY